MSSVKIAELTGKQHKNVKRDIEKILNTLEIDKLKCERIYLDTSNRKQTCYELEERELLILASGYNIKLRASIIDELAKIKGRLANPLRNTLEIAKRYELNKQNIPKGYFCMLKEVITEVVLPLEFDGKDLVDNCLPDGSLGIGFCAYLRKQGIDTTKLKTYKHTFQDGRIVNPKIYPYAYYEMFIKFLDIWIEGKGKPYFDSKTKLFLK